MSTRSGKIFISYSRNKNVSQKNSNNITKITIFSDREDCVKSREDIMLVHMVNRRENRTLLLFIPDMGTSLL